MKHTKSVKDENGSPGFIKSGYINKKGTPHGEKAMLNKLPPGDDMAAQEVSTAKEMHCHMKLKKLGPVGYE